MKGVLIIAGPRVGGSNLMQAIAKGSNRAYKYEIDIVKDWHLIDVSSDVCKYIPFRPYITPPIDPNYTYDFNTSFEVDKVVEYSKLFDKVIIANRRDKVEQTESLHALEVQNDNRNFISWNVDLVDKESNLYKNLSNYIIEMDKCLTYLSKALNVEMDYYEDVYSSKSINDSSIPLDYKWFSKNRKLRKSLGKKTIQ
jgi:hypothetical protein